MNKNLDGYIGGLKTLPTPPGVLLSLITLFQQPDRDIDDIAELIRQDPSLTAGVLRHANSAYCLPDEPIVEVFEAIAWVGFAQVYQAVLAKLASQSLQLPKGACGIDVDQLWHHSAIAGVCAGAIAKRVGENEGLAFTAGLLHDVGKIVLSLAEGEEYTALAKKVGAGGSAMQEAEEIHFGFGHAEVGASLLGRWGLSKRITEPVARHHQVNCGQPEDKICAVVSLGNIMAHAADGTLLGGDYDSERAASAMRVLRLGQDDLAAILDGAQKDIAQMTGLMGAAAK
jgi:putative nucleotidyltransferase with HDIG domain